MSTLQTINQEELGRILWPSIQHQHPVVVTHHSPRGWRMFKSIFAPRSEATDTIVLKSRIPSDTPDSTLPQRGDTLGCTFRFGQKKCMFTTRLESIEREGRDGVLVVGWPKRLEQLKRRLCERAEPPSNLAITVRLWRVPVSSSKSVDARIVSYGQLVDLSVGGICVRVACADRFQLGSSCRCAFGPPPGQPTVVADALVRHREAVDHGRACVGLQFVGLETTPEGRRILDLLAQTVSRFQRTRTRIRH